MERPAGAWPTDEELVRRFRGGDEGAFDQIVLRHRKDIYRVAYRITGDHAEADDLAQETFCRAYGSLREFRGEASLRTWLCRIVANLSLNVVCSARVAWRDRTTVEELAESGRGGTTPPAAPEALMRRERDARLKIAIEALPRKQRSTLLLRAFEGLPYGEIAQIMGCSVGTAKANFFHAVAFLRRRLGDLR